MTERELKAVAEGAKLIPLTQGKFAIVDAEDYESLTLVKWRVLKDRERRVYARRNARQDHSVKTVYMHRQILGGANGYIDHRNGDGLDNRRANIRFATNSQNQANRKAPKNNTTGVKGVSLQSGSGRYMARIKYQGKIVRIGLFDTLDGAASAYQKKAAELFGEFAR